jgi:DnaJ-class molecular chaperone
MPFKKGQSGNPKGRTRGAGSAATTIKEYLASIGCSPAEYLASVVQNRVPCRVCRGAGKTKFQPAGSERFQGERTCQSCWGSKLERISPELAVNAAAKLLERTEPQLKAIEVSGSADKPPVSVRVVLVKSDGRQLD